LLGVWLRCAGVYGQTGGGVPAEDPQDLFDLDGEVVQDYWSGRVLLLVIAVLAEADDRSQGSQVTEIDISHIDVQDTGAIGGLWQRGYQVGDAAHVNLPGQDELHWIAMAGDRESFVGEQYAPAAGGGPGCRTTAAGPGARITGERAENPTRATLGHVALWTRRPGIRHCR
jgi:hypothetical protein